MGGLKRKLGFWHAYATATGLVVAGSTMVSLGNSMGLVGPAFIVSAFIAMVVSIMIALSYAELSSFLPGAGMIGDYTLVAMGKFMAIVAVLGGYLVLVAVVGPMETMTAGFAAQYLFPDINTTLFAVGVLALFLLINLLGVELFGAIQVLLVAVLMGTTAIMGVLGLLDAFTIQPSMPVEFNPNGWSTVFQSLALGIWLFIGIEYVVPMGEEVKNPTKTIPRAMIVGLVTIFIADMLFGMAISRHLDLNVLMSVESPHIEGALAMFGSSGGTWMVIVTILAATSSINANFAAVPRMFYGLAREGMLPKVFMYLHSKYRTPWAGILFVFSLFCLPLFVLNIDISLMTTMLLSASCTWLISYIIAQVNVLILRKRYPDIDRPFKAPFTPYIQLVGIAVCVYMIVTIHPDMAMKQDIYLIAGSMLAGICLYAFVWLKYKKEPLFQPMDLEAKQKALVTPEESAELELIPQIETK